MLSLDEYNLAGGSSSYLVNGQFYWTLTPQSTSTARDVNNVGDAYGGGDVTNVRGLRPVITISSDAIITSGDGTLSATSNGYILNQTLDNVTNKKVSEVVTSGEYVIYDSRTYRVVEKNSDGVKLILDGFYTTHGVITVKNVDMLVSKGKLQIDNIKSVLSKYRTSTTNTSTSESASTNTSTLSAE